MDWICVSPKFICWGPNCPPQLDGIGRWGLCEVTKVRRSHEGGALMMAWKSESYSVVSNPLWSHGLYRVPGSSVHGILQARILESVALSFSRGSSQNKDWTQVSHIAGKLFTIWATREAPRWHKCPYKKAGREIFVFILWTHSEKAAIFQTAGILNKTQSCHHTDLRLSVSRTVGK